MESSHSIRSIQLYSTVMCKHNTKLFDIDYAAIEDVGQSCIDQYLLADPC